MMIHVSFTNGLCALASGPWDRAPLYSIEPTCMVIDKKCRICRDKCGIYRLPNRCATHRTTTKAWQITLVCMKRPRRDTNGEGEFKVNETSPPHKARAYWTDNGFWCTPFTSTPMPSRDECHCCLLLMANHAIGSHAALPLRQGTPSVASRAPP